MYLIDYIKEHKNWREELSNKPYSLKIKDDEGFTLFMYNQIESDFYNPIVKEARGVILDLAGEEPCVVCRAFDKFGNYGEGYVDDIDWASARVQEKVDGSIMKVWYYKGNWHLSSNSCIDAFKAALTTGYSLGDIFITLFNDFLFDKLDKDCTYVFELVSPYNRVVIDYGESKLYLIGKRNNLTDIEEIPEDLGMARPAEYPLSSLEECISAAALLNEGDEVKKEGFVVVDKNFHRIKIKSPLYVAKHHVMTNKPSFEDLVSIWKEGEKEEFLSYFPAYANEFDKMDYWEWTLNERLRDGKVLWDYVDHDRKRFALEVKNWTLSGFVFEAMKYGDWSVDRVKALPHEQLARFIKNWKDETYG